MELRRPISELVDNPVDLLLVKRDDNSRYKDDMNSAHVINGIIGAPPKSAFIQWCIQRVFRNLINDDLNKSVNIATGPRVINQALPRFERQLTIRKLSFTRLQEYFLSYRRAASVSK